LNESPLEESRWPADLFREPADALRWAMPRAFGGDELDPLELHLRYEQLARRSLALALILTQRDSAVGAIVAGGNDRLLAEVRDGAFVTVGIAQLTTSRQGGPPALIYRDGHVDGVIPWVTGAAQAKYVVAGAAVVADDAGGQILFALPTDAPGVTVDPPLPLVALRETWTSRVRCANVAIDRDLVLLGPAPNVLSLRRRSVPIPQAFLALGHARGGLDLIAEHDSDRARNLVRKFGEQIDALHARVVAACAAGSDPALAPLPRGACNHLALRVTHAAVALYKGNALLISHPAQRLAREAMFLLVWSCPDPVIDCTVDLLAAP
jgi:alkylation response protein AidB-like acyl-CoA dehydrogenase